MKGAAMHTAAKGSTDDHWHRGSPAIMVLGRDLGDLIERAGDEVGELHLYDWTQAHHRGSDGGSHKAGLGQRCVQDSPLAVFLKEALGDLEGPAIGADIFAHQKNPFVARHFLVQSLRDRLKIGHFLLSLQDFSRHGNAPTYAVAIN